MPSLIILHLVERGCCSVRHEDNDGVVRPVVEDAVSNDHELGAGDGAGHVAGGGHHHQRLGPAHHAADGLTHAELSAEVTVMIEHASVDTWRHLLSDKLIIRHGVVKVGDALTPLPLPDDDAEDDDGDDDGDQEEDDHSHGDEDDEDWRRGGLS